MKLTRLAKAATLSYKALASLMHMTGSDYPDKDPLFRNYANLPEDSPEMLELHKLGFVESPVKVEGYAASAFWHATASGLELAKQLHMLQFGEKRFKDERKERQRAHKAIFNSGIRYKFPNHD